MRTIAIHLLLVLALGCGRASAPGASAAEPAPQNDAQAPSVTFPDGFVVRVETAANNELRAQGLMHRDALRPGTGMLFFFPSDGAYSFWMKNTRIALDIIWIDSSKRIVDVKHDVPPCVADPCTSYHPAAPARYVLEVAAGVAREHGLKAGDLLQFANVDHIEAR